MNPTHALLDIAPEVQAALAQGQFTLALVVMVALAPLAVIWVLLPKLSGPL